MTRRRPHFYDTIAQLEQRVEECRDDRSVLEPILAELGHRDTDRAKQLRKKITALLEEGERNLGRPVTWTASSNRTKRHAVSQRLETESGTTAETAPAEDSLVSAMEDFVPLEQPPVAQDFIEPEIAGYAVDSEPAGSDEPEVSNPADPTVLSRMLDLIDYVIAVEKDKLKLVTDAAGHKGIHYSHDALANLPGISFNRDAGEDVAFLAIERLVRKAPPEPSDPMLKAWLVIADEPTREPHLREALRAAECKAIGVDLEEGADGVALDAFENADALRASLKSYLDGPWAAWAKTEAPRRKTISIYGSFFSLRQALSAPDGAPQELVCGLGYAALVRNGKRLHYPLLTIPLDIELDPKSHILSLVPRAEARPGVEADPLDALGLSQVDVWRRQAVQHIEALEDDSLSPFARFTFEPVLSNAAALLDPGAQYSQGEASSPLPLPIPGSELRITDGFAFLQRERRASQLMADLVAFRDLLVTSDGAVDVPPAIAALFTDPSEELPDEEFPTFRGINSIPGVTSSDGFGEELFFPKPFNAEQVQIAQRLAVRHGVVVQGPPGTGKTHTIANIISHYLATGRRVLVTSQKTPALRVLQEQLPPAIRPLAVSLLDSDREGLRQFRGSVDLISERLQHLRKSELDDEISSLESKIDGLHRKLAANDRETDQIGRTALSALDLDGIRIEPLDAAREVLEGGDKAFWLPDDIYPDDAFLPRFDDDDIAELRNARERAGNDLAYISVKLPPADLLADPDIVISAHESLQKASDIENSIKSGEVWALSSASPETIELVEDAYNKVARWNQRRVEFSRATHPNDEALERLFTDVKAPERDALEQLRDEATELENEYRFFLTRPIDLPPGCIDDVRFRASVSDMAAGGSGLGKLAGLFARATKASLIAVRLKGRAPSNADDWQVIDRYMAAVERAASFVRVWSHSCEAAELPAMSASGLAVGREALSVLDRLAEMASLEDDAATLTAQVRKLFLGWSGLISRALDPADVLESLQTHIELNRLNAARSVRKKLLNGIGNGQTSLHDEMRKLVSGIGEPSIPVPQFAASLASCCDRLDHVHGLQEHFTTIIAVCQKIRDSGAPLWAQQLEELPAVENDDLAPEDWNLRWRLRQLDNWLEASNQADRLRELYLERAQAEADLSKTYVRLIEQRTWRALKDKASPSVMQALAAYAVAVGKIGRGTGKSANRHRKTARSAADAVKGALPCWIMPHHRVSESLPPELGIFDLVIVDEASQSTLSALPALFRANQILVVGDDKQVSPDNVGLNMEQSNTIAARYLASQVPMFKEPMRQESSLYDLASVIFGADRFMLREHFRCAAPIIEFSKRQFYRNELCPLRLSKASERLDPVLMDVLVRDGYRKGKTNPPEADFIISELRSIGERPSFDGRTVGVTTLLGTEQAALIYSRIENELGIPFIEKFKVRVGDPAAFQGDERDIMFLSMVATPDQATALSGLPFEQRFNVAASRARERMILVRSIEIDQLSPNDKLRRALLEHFRSPFPNDTEAAADARLRCESDFEREVFDALFARGYALDTQVRVGQHRIDIVVEGDQDRRLAIECDGDRYHGPEQWPSDMQRQRTLERAGWRFWRCFASRFVRERDIVLQELCELLDEMRITPRSAEKRSTVYTGYREWTSETAEALVTTSLPTADVGLVGLQGGAGGQGRGIVATAPEVAA